MSKKSNGVDCLLTGWNGEHLTYEKVLNLRAEYYKYILKNNSVMPASNDTIAWIKHFKRDLLTIGPWENITPSEAVNRIASDLVMLKGIPLLINSQFKNHTDLKIKLQLGNSHNKNERGDFLIYTTNPEETFRGEVFNVADSYYVKKLRATVKSWKGKDTKLNFILVNAEVLVTKNIDTLKKDGIQLIGVTNWDDITT